MHLLCEDMRIAAPDGRLFVRRWRDPDADDTADVPIVLLHDSLGCVELWRDFPEQLARATGRTVVAYDRLGFGQSDPHPGTLDAGFVRNEARTSFAALRDALRLDRFVLFGHSVGGGMAVACAAHFADACDALITASAQAFVEDRTVRGILDAKQAFAREGQVDRLRKYHGDKAPWVLSAWIDTWLAPDFAQWNLDDDLRRVRCRVLALHGDLDEYGSVEHPRRIASLAAGPARAVVLEGCGHVPHRERAGVVFETVAEWLAGA
ncbi:MAG TPA: alpha/beta hydrolase [Tahibacter sp.]|nr:alpha/beta hydrolase [Tahibacter sp.]